MLSNDWISRKRGKARTSYPAAAQHSTANRVGADLLHTSVTWENHTGLYMKNEQLRKHLKFTLRHRWRLKWHKRRLAHCGEGVFFDKNIEILRFPGNVSIEAHVVVKEGARICACNTSAKIGIGANTTVGYHTFMFASNRISIGHDCLIAPFVYIVDSDHSIEKGSYINQQPNQTAPITIGNDVWLGTGAKILKGVTIGNGAVVAAGAIVKDDVAPYSIVGGVPAKKIGERPTAESH